MNDSIKARLIINVVYVVYIYDLGWFTKRKIRVGSHIVYKVSILEEKKIFSNE